MGDQVVDIGEVTQGNSEPVKMRLDPETSKKDVVATPKKEKDLIKEAVNENWQSTLADIRRKKALTETPLSQFLHRAKRWTVTAAIGGLLMLDDVGQMAEPFISTTSPPVVAGQAFVRGKLLLDDFNMEAADRELERENIKDILSRKDPAKAGASPNPQDNEKLFSEK